MIVAAAIRINQCVCTMQAPARHHDILRQISGLYEDINGEEIRERPTWTYEHETQGFITDKGEFLNRREAMAHVIACGQGTPKRRAGPTNYQGDELFSEDLW